MFFGGDPFEHFAQQHGAGGGRARRADANVDTTKLYETLNVSLSWVSSWQVSVLVLGFVVVLGTADWLCGVDSFQ